MGICYFFGIIFTNVKQMLQNLACINCIKLGQHPSLIVSVEVSFLQQCVVELLLFSIYCSLLGSITAYSSSSMQLRLVSP